MLNLNMLKKRCTVILYSNKYRYLSLSYRYELVQLTVGTGTFSYTPCIKLILS
jgi:hypothetical protein